MPPTDPTVTLAPAAPITIGSVITATTTSQATAAASAAAAIDADAKAKADADASMAQQGTLAADLALTGPITMPNPDGTYSTFSTSTTAPFYSVEISAGVNTLVPTPPAS